MEFLEFHSTTISFASLMLPHSAHHLPVTFVQYSRLQTGGCGENSAEFASTSVHVVVTAPTNSKPESQL